MYACGHLLLGGLAHLPVVARGLGLLVHALQEGVNGVSWKLLVRSAERPAQPGFAYVSVATRAAVILGPHLALRPIAMLGLRWDAVDLVHR